MTSAPLVPSRVPIRKVNVPPGTGAFILSLALFFPSFSSLATNSSFPAASFTLRIVGRAALFLAAFTTIVAFAPGSVANVNSCGRGPGRWSR